MKYGLNDKPGAIAMLLYGFQWWAASLPNIVILGLVLARLQFTDLEPQLLYLQKLFALMGATTAIQALWGHRLPLVTGPSAPLLLGFIASVAAGFNAMHTAVLMAGLLMAVAGFSGILGKMRIFFTPRIIAVILMLIALTVSPTIRNLLFQDNARHSANLVFAVVTAILLVWCNSLLPGVCKSLTVIIGIGGGTLAYFLLFGFPSLPAIDPAAMAQTTILIPALDFNGGAILSFLFCYVALTINEISSIEAVGHLVGVSDLDWRIKRGSGLQGLANMASGALGVIGPVDFSLSAGVIAATGNASRFTLVPAGIALMLCSLSSSAAQYLSCIPNPVMGTLLVYLMSLQLCSGVTILARDKGVGEFSGAITVALPLMLGILVCFAPANAFSGFPDLLRPIVGNGFVVGTIAVVFLEHAVFRKKTGEMGK